MKKQSILSLVLVVAMIAFSACNKYSAKKVSLSSQNDSLNYTLGYTTGVNIKGSFMQKDSSDKPVKAFISSIDQAFKSGKSNQSSIYKIGVEIGSSFKQFKSRGLFNDSTIKYDEKLIHQGMVNGLRGFKEGMTAQQAQEYIQRVMMKRQQAKMGSMPQQQDPRQAPQQAPQEAPQQAPAEAK